jgi:hypothetical protein
MDRKTRSDSRRELGRPEDLQEHFCSEKYGLRIDRYEV